MLEQLNHVHLIRWYQTSAKRFFMLSEDVYDDWAILAVDEGSFEYRLAGEKGIAKYGDMIFCPPGVTLERRELEPVSFLFIEFNWGEMTVELQTTLASMPRGKVSFHRIDRFSSIYALIREFSDIDIQDHLIHKQYLLKDLLYLYILEHQDSIKHVHAKDSIVRTAVSYLQNHAFEPLSLKVLADRAALSQSQFSRRFQAEIGVSPVVYLTGIRLRKAQNLLMNSELTLDEIALQCGYQSGFYLSRVFKNRYGISPSQFRNSNRI